MINQNNNTKKILIADDSALMRRLICDIINNDKRFEVEDMATNGLEALELLSKKKYDAVVLDVSMPKMDGLQLLRELRSRKIPAKVLVVSSHTYDGAKTTMEALTLGAMDFLRKPDAMVGHGTDVFRGRFLELLEVVSNGQYPKIGAAEARRQEAERLVQDIAGQQSKVSGSKVVAIASSTGGPRALQAVIPFLPKNLDAPVLLVQHMPRGFTLSLAERLNDLSNVCVKEAEEGEELKKGTVYVAAGGMHMTVKKERGDKHVIHYTDEPAREGVKPCANYMFESLMESDYDNIACVVMTGMGADGTAGIRNLRNSKKIYVIAQNQETSTVYGMPKSVVQAGLSDIEVPLEQIAQKIVLCAGERRI